MLLRKIRISEKQHFSEKSWLTLKLTISGSLESKRSKVSIFFFIYLLWLTRVAIFDYLTTQRKWQGDKKISICLHLGLNKPLNIDAKFFIQIFELKNTKIPCHVSLRQQNSRCWFKIWWEYRCWSRMCCFIQRQNDVFWRVLE